MLARLPSQDLVAGEGITTRIRRVRVGDSHVLVARLADGDVVAFGPSCPHQFTELDEATIWDGNLRCPRHSYQYDTRTGENIHPRRHAPVENLWKLRPGYLPCYTVREANGWIVVSDQVHPPPASFDPALEERPAQARPVAVEGTATETAMATATETATAPEPVTAVEQSVKFLTVAAGTTFDIRLPIIPRPGFAWQLALVGQLLEVVEEQFEPGYSPCQLVRVTALGSGVATLSCTYANDSGEQADVRIFIVRIQNA